MKFKKIFLSIAVSLCLGLTGCQKDTDPGDYDSSEVGKIKKVVPGVIISMRPVRLHDKNADIGANANISVDAESNTGNGRSHGFEYVIKLNSGGIISVVQAERVKLKTRQHILVIYGRNTRVVPDNGSDDF